MSTDAENASGLKGIEVVFGVISSAISLVVAILSLKFEYLPRGAFAVGLTFVVLIVIAAILFLITRLKKRLVNAFVIPLGIVTALAALLLVPVWFVLVLSHFELQGEKLNSPLPEQFIMTASEQPYRFHFDRDISYAEVYIRPNHPDRGRVEKLTPLGLVVAPEDKDKIRHLPRDTDNEEHYGFTNPTKSLNAAVKFRVQVTDRSPQFPVTFLASYTYWHQTRLWRWERWVFQEFGKL
jgi:hypothetical protein